MLRVRIIPVLLLSGDGVVKTRKFARPKYVGDSLNTIKLFSEMEADEIIILDIDASRQRREPNYKLIEILASEAFMPVCYGGNVSNAQIAKRLISLGVEKVAVNRSALGQTRIISEIADTLGAQSVVGVIDYKVSLFGRNLVYSYLDKRALSKSLDETVREYVEAGCGEILINAVHLDGTRKGMDIGTVEKISSFTKVPLLVCGGAGNLNDLLNSRKAGASGVCAGSLFVYHGSNEAVLINYPGEKVLKQLFGEFIKAP